MKTAWKLCVRLAVLPLLALWGQLGTGAAFGADTAPAIAGVSKPQAGDMQVLFRGGTGPFTVQRRLSLDASAPWVDMPTAKVTQVNTGVFVALIPTGTEDAAFYRVVSAGETIVELKGWTVGLKVSTPTNGAHFVAGEQPVVTVSILDNFGQGMTKTSFSSFALYMYGPEDPLKTVTAVKLLNASTNRAVNPHHYIDLKTNAGVTTNGNTLTYQLQPVTDEAAGTYTIAVRAALSADAIQQVVKFATVQIGTSTVESKVYSTAKCAECHKGPISGKLYMAHADVSSRSPVGSWSLDLEPEKSCKMCHNNEGYAAFTDPAALSIGITNRVSDHIAMRVHGVHMGEGLKNYWNTNSTNGVFRDYMPVVFPADVRNCTACHVDDRWKTKPSRLACGTCHDNVYFGSGTVPTNMVGHDAIRPASDTQCLNCHGHNDDGVGILEVHAVPQPRREFEVGLTMTPPANASYYVAGEAPQVTIKVKDKATSLFVDPALIAESNAWNRAVLLVSGPRSGTVPVLTTQSTNTSGSYPQNDWRSRTNAANNDPRIVSRTADSVVYQLATITNLAAGTYTVYAEVRKATTNVVGSTAVTNNYSIAKLNFQVGTATVEPLPAGNCAACHGDTVIHATSRAVPYSEVDMCKMCHDYKRQYPSSASRTNWTGSGQSQFGFGVAPLSRRVHGIHFGRYVHKPQEIQTQDFSEVIFPVDVRNCTKCHSDTKSLAWIEKPGRLACFSCHDSDSALQHGKLMTYDPTSTDPWSGDEIETCTICHGKSSSFAPSVVHAISNPYVPPYPREPAE